MYKKFIKRLLDFILSLCALIALSPVLVILMIVGTIAMKGNPFFTQLRPGWHEKKFKLIKFRTMDNRKDENGMLLPDEYRLNRYGSFLRTTSLDELPELINILKGDMSIIGPRPLLVKYLPYYTETERRRHAVRPGLTGLAQINGRNNLPWNERLAVDVNYVETLSFRKDVDILMQTVMKVIKHENVVCAGAFSMRDLDKERGGNMIKLLTIIDVERYKLQIEDLISSCIDSTYTFAVGGY